MKKIQLGRTGLFVTKTSFGALPVQRLTLSDAVSLLRAAFDGGINYYDTARAYSDSEEKIGHAFEGIRREVIISTKSGGTDKKTVAAHIDMSLKMMRTDYIDLFQFHNPAEFPDPDDPESSYAAALEAKKAGKILHIGITSHRIPVAEAAIRSGKMETLQFPFSYLSLPEEIALAEKCLEAGLGFIAMKGLAGGLLTNARACHAFMAEYENVVPIWGVQTLEQLQEWLDLAEEDPRLDSTLSEFIENDRKEFVESFCRACNYCAPCPVDIEINMSARMNMLLRRSPWQQYYTDEWREKMNRINDCLECGSCKSKCPYGLDTPALLKFMLEDYNAFFEAHKSEL